MNRIFVIFCLLAQISAAGAAPPKDLVKATLVASVSSIQGGVPFKLGVVFNIKRGWHIYWKNPGDSGMATRITWNLPSGFTAGELQFPIPRRIEQPGNEVVFAYENQVMLQATITPPKNLPIDATLPFSADASWLVCDKVCIPGKASMPLPMRTSMNSQPANQSLFDAWTKRLPIAADKQSTVIIHAKPMDLSAGKGKTDIELSSSEEVSVFPAAVDGLLVEVGSAQKTAQGQRIPLTAEILQGQQVKAKNLQVLVGRYDVNIPLIGAAGPEAPPRAP